MIKIRCRLLSFERNRLLRILCSLRNLHVRAYSICVKDYIRCSYKATVVILPLSTCPKWLNVTVRLLVCKL